MEGRLPIHTSNITAMQEIYKTIPGHEFYQASNLGNIKSMPRMIYKSTGNYISKERVLKKCLANRGRHYVSLYSNEDIVKYQVSVLVAMTFLGHKPNKYKLVVDHIDNDPLNNTLGNLQLITARENTSKNRTGTSKYTGVTWDKSRSKWYAGIIINGKSKYLGRFENELEASEAYQSKLETLN